MPRNLRILLIIETSRAYGRKLLRGIARYAMLNGPWNIEHLAPFYLQQTQNIGDVSFKMIDDIDGIIMREQKNIEPLIERGIPIVFASYLTKDVNIPAVQTEDEKIAKLAFEYFQERGFENFAYVGFDGMFWSDKRKEAFARFVQEAGYSYHGYMWPKAKKQQKWNQEQDILADWLKQLPKPVALLTCNDDRAQHVFTACRNAELSIPEEIAIVGVDNDEFICTLAHPPLSSVNLNVEIAGFEAASVLDRMIRGENIHNFLIPVDPNNIVTRQSSDILAIKDPLIAQAVHFIRKHIREPIQIDDLLTHLPVSRRSFCDRFKQMMQCSVHQYIKKKRVDYIEHLLTDTEMSISNIAYHMGFNSDEHIASYFRSVKGMNPHKFRISRKIK